MKYKVSFLYKFVEIKMYLWDMGILLMRHSDFYTKNLPFNSQFLNTYNPVQIIKTESKIVVSF